MNAKEFLLSMNEIDSRYIEEADIFGPEPAVKVSPVFQVMRWAGGLAACLALVGGLWFLGRSGLLPFLKTTPQPGGSSSVSEISSGAKCLSEEDVTIDKDGNLTFSDPEFQEMQRVFLRHEPVTVGEEMQKLLPGTESDPVSRVLTLTLPLFTVDQYPVEARTHILCELREIDFLFCTPEDSSQPSYLLWNTVFNDMAGTVGYYDENGAYYAEQPYYFAQNNSYFKSIQEFMGLHSDDPGNPHTEASAAIEKRETMLEEKDWNDVIYKLLYSYLEQNDLLEYARVRLLTGEMVELSGGDSIADANPLNTDFAPVSVTKEGNLLFVDPEYQECYHTIRKYSGDDTDPASAAGDDACTGILSLPLPYYVLGHYPAEDGTTHLLCMMGSTEYGFFEKDGEKSVKPINAYHDLVGIIAVSQENGSIFFRGQDIWYPGDGNLYVSSIAEFTGLTEEDTAALLENADRTKTDFLNSNIQPDALLQQLLFAYMSQNDMTDYRLEDGEVRLITEEELRLAAQRNAEAEEAIQQKRQQQGLQNEPDSASQESFEEEVRATAKQIAKIYVNQWLSDTEYPLTECFYQDLKVSGIYEGEDSFLISLRMVFKPKDEESLSYWWAGNTKPGTEENEGYYTASRFIKAKKVNGEWSIESHGTGGFGAPNFQETDWTIE